jgi:hypothetical protein
VELNGVYTDEADIVLAKCTSYSVMIDTYLHEFSHFITRDAELRALIEKLTVQTSEEGYYDDTEADYFYDVAVYDEKGVKKNFYEVYEILVDYEREVFRAKGFVDGYALKDSWEDFATTAEAMFAYHHRGLFIDYARKANYDVLGQKCDAVMQIYNEYALLCDVAPFMDEAYFTSLRRYRLENGYTNSLIR